MRWVPARSYHMCQNHLFVEFVAFRYVLRTWKTMPEEMIGVIPSSMRVPLLLAIIILSQ